MSNARWGLLAAAHPAADALLRFLSPRDAICWLVSALEAGDATVERLLARHLLWLEGDARVLHCALAHGCLRAACRLRRRVRRQRTSTQQSAHGSGEADDTFASLAHWIDAFRPLQLPPSVVLTAAAVGDLRVVRWLHAHVCYEPLRTMRVAAERGHLHVTQWLAENSATARRLRSGLVTVDVRLGLNETRGLAVAWAVTRMSEIAPHHRPRCTHFLATRKGFAAPQHTSDAAQRVYDAPLFAAATGDLELLELLLEQRTWRFSARTLAAALDAGRVDVAEWLTRRAGVTTRHLDMKSVLVAAIRKDHLRVLQWCHAADREQFDRFFALGTMMLCSHVDILRWSYALAPASPWSPGVLLAMARSGLWDSVKWVYATFSAMAAAPELVDVAAAAGDFGAFRIALDRQPASAGYAVTKRTLELACESGNLALAQTIAHDCGVWSPFAVMGAASKGHTAIVAWLLGHSSVDRFSAVPEAQASVCASSGHFECAEWLLQHLPPPSKLTFPARGHFEAGVSFSARDAAPAHLAWDPPSRSRPWRQRFVELVLRWQPEMLMDVDFVGAWAARNGHCGIVAQLIKMEHPFVVTKPNLRHLLTSSSEAGWVVRAFLEQHPEWLDLTVVRWAARHSQLSVLTFVFANRWEAAAADVRFAAHTVISTASRFGRLEVLRWMRSRSDRDFGGRLLSAPSSHDPWNGALTCAAAGGHTDVAQWLVAEGLVDLRLMRSVVRAVTRSDSASVLELLRAADLLTSMVTPRDLNAAMSRGSVRVVKWIKQRCPQVLRDAGDGVAKAVDKFLHAQSPTLLL